MSAEVILFSHKALKTIGGAIHYDLTRYQQNEICDYFWEQFRSFLKVEKNTCYCIEELNKYDFTLSFRDFTFRYIDNDNHEKRVVEIIKR